ncbi:zinc ABC transporter permease AztB [Propioniferax innocua]
MEWLLDPFLMGIQQRALMGGILVALMAPVAGTWLVLRGMTFFGDAFMHGVLPGIAAAVLFGFSPMLGAALAALVMVVGLEVVRRQTALREDAGIGLLFVGMLALGVVMVSKTPSYAGSITSILFGDALGITPQDLRTQAVIATLVIGLSIVLHRPLITMALHEGKAAALGMNPRLANGLLLAMIAMSVIGSYRTVGTLLVFGLMVGPAATASLFARSVRQMMVLAVTIALFSVVIGLVVSYHLSTAASATMGLVPVALFFILLTVQQIVVNVRRRGVAHA